MQLGLLAFILALIRFSLFLRELALQISDEFKALGAGIGLKCSVVSIGLCFVCNYILP